MHSWISVPYVINAYFYYARTEVRALISKYIHILFHGTYLLIHDLTSSAIQLNLRWSDGIYLIAVDKRDIRSISPNVYCSGRYYTMINVEYKDLSFLICSVAVVICDEKNWNQNALCESMLPRNWVHLTHWGRVTHMCVSELTIIGSDNGLSPGRRQAIIWNNAGLLLMEPLGTNFSEISIGIQTFSFKKMHLNMSSPKWRPFFLGLNVLTVQFRTKNIYLMYNLSQQRPYRQ